MGERSVEWRAAAAAILVTTAGILPTNLVGALAVQIGAEFDLTASALGSIVSAFFLIAGILAMVVGRTVDDVGWHNGIRLAALGTVCAFTGAAFLSNSWIVLTGFLLLGGVSHAIAVPAGNLGQCNRRISAHCSTSIHKPFLPDLDDNDVVRVRSHPPTAGEPPTGSGFDRRHRVSIGPLLTEDQVAAFLVLGSLGFLMLASGRPALAVLGTPLVFGAGWASRGCSTSPWSSATSPTRRTLPACCSPGCHPELRLDRSPSGSSWTGGRSHRPGSRSRQWR